MRDYKRQELYPHTKTLSSTQVLDYYKSPSEFHITWMLGVDNKEDSDAIRVGRAFSEIFADRVTDPVRIGFECRISAKAILILKEAIKFFPSVDPKLCEYEMKCRFRGWSFRATLDAYFPQTRLIVENKTGKIPWTNERAEYSEQITFQSWVHWKKTGALPRKIQINWVDTNPNARKRVSTFETTRTEKQLKDFQAQVVESVLAGIKAGAFV